MPSSIDIGALITSAPDTCDGRPLISGTRFSVQQVAVLNQQGLSATDIVAEYPFLTLAQVYAALAYYHANLEEIQSYLAEEIAEYDRLVTEHSKQSS